MGARCLTLVLLCLILGTAAQAQDGAVSIDTFHTLSSAKKESI